MPNTVKDLRSMKSDKARAENRPQTPAPAPSAQREKRVARAAAAAHPWFVA
jgi:hypothetical protein